MLKRKQKLNNLILFLRTVSNPHKIFWVLCIFKEIVMYLQTWQNFDPNDLWFKIIQMKSFKLCGIKQLYIPSSFNDLGLFSGSQQWQKVAFSCSDLIILQPCTLVMDLDTVFKMSTIFMTGGWCISVDKIMHKKWWVLVTGYASKRDMLMPSKHGA